MGNGLEGAQTWAFCPPNPGVCPGRAPVPARGCQCCVGTWGRSWGLVAAGTQSQRARRPAVRCCALLLFWEAANLGKERRPEKLAWGAGSRSQQGNSSPYFWWKVLMHPGQGIWENLPQVSGCQVSRRCLQK